MTMMRRGIHTHNVNGVRFGVRCFMAMAVFACSGPEHSDRDNSHTVQAMLDSLYERGFDSDQVALLDQHFLIERDMLAEPESLRSELEVDKGYYIGSNPLALTPPRADSIDLVFDGISTSWRTAIGAAAAQWSDAVCINILVNPANPTGFARITATNEEELINAGVPAAAMLPITINGVRRPGPELWVNPDFESLSASAKLAVALHEIGHNLGFAHPEQSVLISGTLQDTTPGNASSYPTVMKLDNTLGSLSADDVSARDRLFSLVGGVCPNGQVSIAN
jgi:hypothetical protein